MRGRCKRWVGQGKCFLLHAQRSSKIVIPCILHSRCREAVLLQWRILLTLLLLQCLREVEEALVVFRIANSMLSVVCWWNATGMLAHLRYRDFVCIRLVVGMHFLCEELNFLLLEVARAYQLCSIHSFLLTNIWAPSSIWHSYCRSSTWRRNSSSLVTSFE